MKHSRNFGIVGLIGVLSALFILNPHAVSACESPPECLVEAAGKRVIAIAASGIKSQEKKYRAVSEVLNRYSALTSIARFAAGRHWREMEKTQKIHLRNTLREEGARFIVLRLDELASATFEVLKVDERPHRSGRPERTIWNVLTRISLPKRQPLTVQWTIKLERDELRIADIIFEGVSLLVYYRNQMQTLFDEHPGDINAAITALSRIQSPAPN